jgi:hypothetical protein
VGGLWGGVDGVWRWWICQLHSLDDPVRKYCARTYK